MGWTLSLHLGRLGSLPRFSKLFKSISLVAKAAPLQGEDPQFESEIDYQNKDTKALYRLMLGKQEGVEFSGRFESVVSTLRLKLKWYTATDS